MSPLDGKKPFARSVLTDSLKSAEILKENKEQLYELNIKVNVNWTLTLIDTRLMLASVPLTVISWIHIIKKILVTTELCQAFVY